MSWTSWPATLQPCAECGDQPRTHGPLCGWCNARSEQGPKHAPNELSAAEAHEHFRFYARRVSHAESRYPDGSAREWGQDEPLPARPDTEATAQMANLAAFAHLRELDASLDAIEQERCPSCERWVREYGELCSACNNELSAAERRPPNKPTLASAIAHYCIYSDILRQGYERMEDALLRYQAGEISEQEHVEQFETAAEIWAVTEDGLLEVRDVNLKLGRRPKDAAEQAEPGWVAMPFRCTKCDSTYLLLEELFALLTPDGGMPPAERLGLLELCPACFADETGMPLWEE